MNASADRLEFAPPPQPGTVRAFVLAIIAHVLLMIALTWGINWNRESENIAAEAELWSAVPQQAAPKLVQPPVVAPTPPPPPPPRPVEQKKVEAPPPPAPTVKQPDIAQEREKKKQEVAKQRAQELERQKKLEARKQLEQEKREQLAANKAAQKAAEKTAQKAAQKAAEDRNKQEELAKAAKDKSRQLADAKGREALRQENLKRMQGLAGASGGPTSTGTALQSAGPSDSYGGRIRARVRPNIVFTDDISGNPTAEVEVRMAPDGTITSSKIVKSSGVKSWDNAVLRALDKTETLPRDTDGRVHTPLIIEFRPEGVSGRSRRGGRYPAAAHTVAVFASLRLREAAWPGDGAVELTTRLQRFVQTATASRNEALRARPQAKPLRRHRNRRRRVPPAAPREGWYSTGGVPTVLAANPRAGGP